VDVRVRSGGTSYAGPVPGAIGRVHATRSREQKLLTAVLSEVRKVLPFALLGFDTDNDNVFMNETVRDYCRETGVELVLSNLTPSTMPI